jgi:hypothetical protein
MVRPTAVTALGGSLVGRQLSRQYAFVGAIRQNVRSANLQNCYGGHRERASSPGQIIFEVVAGNRRDTHRVG